MSTRRQTRREVSWTDIGRRGVRRIVVIAIVAAMVTSSFVGVVTPTAAAETLPSGVLGVSECGTLDQANQEYWLTADIINAPWHCFLITADGVTLDGRGYTIDGSGETQKGVEIRANNVVVKNATIQQMFWGVRTYGGTSNGEIRDLLLKETSYGVNIGANSVAYRVYVGGSNHLVTNNEFVGGAPITLDGADNTTVSDNYIHDGRYLYNDRGIYVRSVYGIPSSENVITRNTVGGSSGGFGGGGFGHGIWLEGPGTNNYITDNTFTGNRYENIVIYGSTGTQILRNTATTEGVGVRIAEATGVVVSENHVYDTGNSVAITARGNDLEFSDNVIQNVDRNGIYIGGVSQNVRVLRNTVADVGGVGIEANGVTGIYLADNVVERSGSGVRTWESVQNAVIVDTASSGNLNYDYEQFSAAEVDLTRFETSTATLSGTAYATDLRGLRAGETLTAPPEGYVTVGPTFFVTGKSGGVLDETVYFDGLTLHYTDADVSSLDESSLRIWVYDTATDTWSSLSGTTIDANANTVTVDRWTFSGAYYVALLGQSKVSVTITNPADGAVLDTTSVLLTGTATSTTGTVTDVEVSLDGGSFSPATLAGSDWSYALDSLAEGEHTVVVQATDELGITNTSEVSFIVDTTPPTIESVTLDPSLVGGGDTVTVTVSASDANGVRDVTADGTSLTQETSGNWVGTLTAPTTDGSVTVGVVATDTAGNQATASDSYTVDATAPTLTLSAPAENTTGTVEATGSATDTNGVASAELVVDGTAQPLTLAADGSFAVTLTLDEGTHTLTLRATDTVGNTAETSTTVTVDLNDPPVADAGPDQIVNELTTVTLDASGSLDADGDPLTYDWTQTTGPTVTLSDATAVAPTFTAPEVSDSTALTFEVTVSDGEAWDTDTVTVTVEPVVHVVPIDVDPVDVDNNVSTKGVIRVVVYGTSDVATSDIVDESLRFGNESTIASGGGAAPINNGQVRDVDGDGRDDLTVAFRADLSGLVPGDTLAVLVGDLVDGTELRGEDAVTVEDPGGGSTS